MKIGELAKLSGCSVQTIRYYEKEGLFASIPRSEGNFRLYSTVVVDQLMFIKQCRSLDLTLPEIRQLLELNRSPDTQCDDVNRMIEGHITQVNQRIQELKKLHRQLTLLRTSCSNDRTIENCGILQNLSTNNERDR